jgi:ParB/RepB/Spo0J family partition protein
MTTPDVIIEVPLDQLHESPFNSRQLYTGLAELAESIKTEGRIHQPLLVRPIRPNRLHDDIISGYELVFGHRRLRAAHLAALATAPCMVREMTDAEVRSAQAVENLQREAIHAFEEAQGYADMMAADGLSAEDVAARVGKSRSHVYARLKLLQACPEIRAACLAGEIGAEVALLVARLRTPQLQAKALAAIKADHRADMQDGGKASYRAVQTLLKEKFTLQLKQAIFATEDATLVPKAGPCRSCPKLSGNAPEFADLVEGTHTRWGGYRAGDATLCTDPDCWDSKRQAHLARVGASLQAQGKTVINGNKARQYLNAAGEVKGAYIELSRAKALLKQAPKPAGKKAPGAAAAADPLQQVVHIVDQRTGKVVQAVPSATLQAAGGAAAASAKQARGGHQALTAEDKAAKEAAVQAKTARQLALLHHVRGLAAQRDKGLVELRLVVCGLLQGDAYDGWEERQLVHRLHGVANDGELFAAAQEMDMAQLGLLLLDLVLVRDVHASPWRIDLEPEALRALAEHYGVDPDAELQAPAQPAAAAAEGPGTPPSAGAGAALAGRPVAAARAGGVAGTAGQGQGPEDAAGAAKVKDEAGFAGTLERDPNTADMFEVAGV